MNTLDGKIGQHGVDVAILAHLEARRDHDNAHHIQSQSTEEQIIALEVIRTLVIALQTQVQVTKF